MTTEFSSFGLHPELVQAVADRGYESPTPIQAGVIPIMLAGQDVIGQAQTGTGKTAAFALPILHNLTAGLGQVQSLVLAPTRELAMQVANAMFAYGRGRNVRVLAVYGGQPYGRQVRRLRSGVDVVVSTPGRLLDLMRQHEVDLRQVRTVVLDEADEMLSMGFIEDIETILNETPDLRQTALFSATMPAEIRRLADRYMRNPHSVTIERQQRTVAAIEQRYYLVNEDDKLAALSRLFEMETITRAIVFVRTRAGTGTLANELVSRGFSAEALNGDLSQDAREQVLNRFRQDQLTVLVATDVAARGLDIDDVSHVFNYDLPLDPELFVHRIGRTGRAGKTGTAISLVTPNERRRLQRIESYTRQKMTLTTLPTVAEIQAHRESQLLRQMRVWLQRDRCRREREIVTELSAEGYDPLEIAAAALKVARAEEKQRPIPPVSEVHLTQVTNRRESGPRRGAKVRQEGRVSHEAGMVRLTLGRGKAHGLRPNDVVGMIAYHANIPGRAIGKISIKEQHTLVDVPQEFVAQILDKAGSYRVHKQSVTIERA
ncbi:MAG: DEAD/DEAH box helicase [Anaerolineales bacterium]|nr:DEAD/DEAH box helicase [Anaerolineales bacterium]MCB8953290.1 DEAD/DEAH box helicase [Ardenticatenales bacterium]